MSPPRIPIYYEIIPINFENFPIYFEIIPIYCEICQIFNEMPFSVKLLADIQLQILLSSSLSWFSRIIIDRAPIRRQVSSVNNRGVQLTLLEISLTLKLAHLKYERYAVSLKKC